VTVAGHASPFDPRSRRHGGVVMGIYSAMLMGGGAFGASAYARSCGQEKHGKPAWCGDRRRIA